MYIMCILCIYHAYYVQHVHTIYHGLGSGRAHQAHGKEKKMASNSPPLVTLASHYF